MTKQATFGAAFRAALTRNRLQQKHIADGLGVTTTTVSAWANDQATPTGDNLMRLEGFIGIYEPGFTFREALTPPEPASVEGKA